MKEGEVVMVERDLPRSAGKESLSFDAEMLKDCRRVVVIGVQGWSSGKLV